ncbi:hypothetical protein ORJ04_17435 [Rheinheimera baltica]|uniref:Orphan protein n=1 Tax=Rheinheimera baltica TaxID=67576 RepID=A0ABT9I2Y4_9GAMM|nr:hypothetical protein [Rheinheimera baltica]MDP5137740.1 hypothetical protein [Rheinheimera baltica]
MKTLCLCLALLTALLANNVQAHKFSTAYLDVSERDGQPLIVWQVALHDLAQAKLLSTPDVNTVRWQQVLDSEAVLISYITMRMQFTADNIACTLTPQRADTWVLQQIQGEFYLQLAVEVQCATHQAWQLQYRALFDIEHSHKALLFWHTAADRRRVVLDSDTLIFPAN